MPDLAFDIRPAAPADISALCRMKWNLAAAESATLAINATEADWQRDIFGPDARFSAFVAERCGEIVGMVTSGERHFTGWVGPAILIHDLFVLPEHRGHGIAQALMARVARQASDRGAALVELTVRENNDARIFYEKLGFEQVTHCVTYVIAGKALADLAELAGTIATMALP